MSKADILPDSRPRTAKNRISIKGTTFIPIYCASCGAPGGGVPEEHMTFAFYLCNPCCDKYGEIAGLHMEPDAVFFEKIKNELAERQRASSPLELVKELDDVNSPLSKLAREAPKGR